MTDEEKDLRIQALEQRLARMTDDEARHEKQMAVLVAANDRLSSIVENNRQVDLRQRTHIAQLRADCARYENVMQTMRRAIAEHDHCATDKCADRTEGGL